MRDREQFRKKLKQWMDDIGLQRLSEDHPLSQNLPGLITDADRNEATRLRQALNPRDAQALIAERFVQCDPEDRLLINYKVRQLFEASGISEV